jgi:DNA processing protein
MSREASSAAIALALLASRGVGERTLARWLAWCAARDVSLSDWLGRPRDEMVREFPDKTESIVLALAAMLPEAIERAEKWASRVHTAGGQFVLATQHDYPASLRAACGPAAPPVLTVLGDTSLLERDAAAIVGTRTPSETGAELARLCARWCAARGRVVVSGGAHGVDTVAHQTAVGDGGATVVVLPQGMLTYMVPADLAQALEDGAALLVSQFVPEAPWTTSGAVTRNETIAAVTRMACVIEPHSPGGSLKTGRDALAQHKPVLVYTGVGGPGGALLREGAQPLLGPKGRFSNEQLDQTWSDAVRERPNQADLL